ncbi:hypothetical protein [Rhodococcus maanshanensis]|uniref:Pyridoxamine 5'-phosphate oxidase n=1 Tax=Rhodococcus maanshanensis TaxID=183556 RepID=A0A1H7FYD8_9NOCA|nr:hypothetical protein [Rhodococcus maanshanensis]SEK30804.1 hypothetical protein SAMN05444583_101318 [Rhodococcus maanshanensis]
MPVTWSDEVDAILGGDLTCGLACLTPAGGAVVTTVAPIGLRDRELGTVGFTTSLGFGRKLERIKVDPRVALAYHAREHGVGDRATGFVLVQGEARFAPHPDRATLDEIGTHSEPFMGAPKRGRFWDRWLHAYYEDRVLVTVTVTRVVAWPAPNADGECAVFGTPRPEAAAAPQPPPKKGTGPRVDAAKTGERAARLPHLLLAYRDADRYPAIAPVGVIDADAEGVRLRVPTWVPPGGRRAGLLAHSYRAQLVGLESRQNTGWLEVAGDEARYAPHTETGFRAPANKTILLLANGFLARRGLAKARKQGRVAALG